MIPPGSPLAQITSTKELNQLTSEQIKELQIVLNRNGYKIAIDGILGRETRKAFDQFKLDRKLTHLGLIGVTTIKWLYQTNGNVDNEETEDDFKPKTIYATPLNQSTIIWTDFRSAVSKYFVVGEVSRYSTERIVWNTTHRQNVIRLAKELDKIRAEWGSAIAVTSWYRPPAVNTAVGGVRNSQHLNGGAVDIFPVNGRRVEFERFLDTHWFGRLGYGQRNNRGFTHLDMANGKGWRTGGNKGTRWNY